MIARRRHSGPTAADYQAAREALRTRKTWWLEALYELRIKRGMGSAMASYETRKDESRYLDAPCVRVRFKGQERGCPSGALERLRRLGARIEVVTTQAELGIDSPGS